VGGRPRPPHPHRGPPRSRAPPPRRRRRERALRVAAPRGRRLRRRPAARSAGGVPGGAARRPRFPPRPGKERDVYDAIVVGGRCAGSPTAMLLARKGYRVLLVD